jgi:hypothetical protein
MLHSNLRFEGPFSWRRDGPAKCIFDAPQGRLSGIYLWTFSTSEGRFAYYVGETGRSFASRHMEHLREHMAGFYHLLDYKALQKGQKVVVWNGRYGIKTRESIHSLFARWRELSPFIEEQTKFMEFFLAESDLDVHVRRELERSLALHFASQARSFQDGGVWYRGAGKALPKLRVSVQSEEPINDLPHELVIGSDSIDIPASPVFITK